MGDTEDRLVCAVVAVVGSIPAIATLVTGASFGVAPTIGLGGVVLGAAGLLRRRTPSLPAARARRRS